MSKIMLINILQPEECRIAILEDGLLEELYVERTSHESYVGSIYKGRIVNIEPSIQAAFVELDVVPPNVTEARPFDHFPGEESLVEEVAAEEAAGEEPVIADAAAQRGPDAERPDAAVVTSEVVEAPPAETSVEETAAEEKP